MTHFEMEHYITHRALGNITNLSKEDELCNIQANALEIWFMTMYSLVSVVALLGNSIVCYIIISDHRMRSVTNLFLLNIAITDIVKSVVFVPFNYIVNLMYNYWPFGNFMCSFVSYIQLVAVFGGAFTMVAMSFDRFVAILHPLRPKLTFKGVGFISLLVWIIALTIPLPTAIYSHIMVPPENGSTDCHRGYCMENIHEPVKQIYSLFLMLVQYFIPLAVLTYTYMRIGYVIWIKTIPGEALQTRDERIAHSKRKMVKMMIVVVLLYAICWLPCHVLYIIGDADESIYDWDKVKYLFNSAFLLAASHSCYNPIVYVWMNRRFKGGFKQVFLSCLCRIKSGVKSRRGIIGQTSLTLVERKGQSPTSNHQHS